MIRNIKEIRLWKDEDGNPERKYNDVQIVRIEFNQPCTWTTLDVNDFEKFMRLWIKGEQLKLNGKYQDAYWFKQLVKRIFIEETGSFD